MLKSLEPVSKTNNRFGAVREPVQALQRIQVVCRRIIENTPVLGTDKQASANLEVGTASV